MYVIRGEIRGSGNSITLLYIGRHWNDEYLIDLFFEDHEVVSEERASLVTVRSCSQKQEAGADIEIVDVGWPYQGRFKRNRGYLEFADWLSMILPLREDWDSVVQSFRKTTRKNDLRLLRRNQYSFDFTNDRRAIEQFYSDMYLPSIQGRHGAAAIVAPLRQILKRAQQGKLLQIFRGGQLVIAAVIYPEDDVLYVLWQGLAQRFEERPPEGSVSALYYFSIRYAFDTNLEAVDFGGTRAFLDSGGFRFKRKWGAQIDDSFSPNSVMIRALNNNGNTISFCEQFPLIARVLDGLEAVIVMQADSVDTATLRRLAKSYDCEGLERITVICVSGQSQNSVRIEELDGREYQIIECNAEQFPSRYVRRPAVQ